MTEVEPGEWLQVDRDELVVVDDHGVCHASVLCNMRDAASLPLLRQVEGPPFVVAMCDYFEFLDVAAQYDAAKFEYPTRRWPVEREVQGVITCLTCLVS